MKFKILVALAVLATPMLICAQQPSQAAKDVDTVLFKIQQLNLVKFVTPLLLKKSQINDILSVLEKCRAKETSIRELDAKELKPYEAEVDKAIDSAIKDGSYPKPEFQAKLIKVQDALLIRRRIATNEMVDMVMETCRKSLNQGQMNVMKNLIDPKFVDPSLKVDKMTDEDKVKTYIRQIFLDGMTYDLLKVLYKHVSE